MDVQLEAEEGKVLEPMHLPIAAAARQHFDVTGLCDGAVRTHSCIPDRPGAFEDCRKRKRLDRRRLGLGRDNPHDGDTNVLRHAAPSASLRRPSQNAAASLLSYTDRARLRQGVILGVLCGAVVGLFATFLSGMEGTGNVGAAALALLAGYNVDGVFRFLDELSDRLFQPAAPVKPG